MSPCFSSRPGDSAFNRRNFRFESFKLSGEYKPPEELGNDDGCWPYPFPKCNHVPGLESKYPRCAQVRDLPACATTCPNKAYGTSMQKDTHRAKSWGRLPIGPEKIKQEIFDNGPVAAMMTLYEDFRFYKSGVYVHKTGQMLAAHTLKLIGWGVESGQEYWLAVNAWNEEWGDHGMIKLASSVYFVRMTRIWIRAVTEKAELSCIFIDDEEKKSLAPSNLLFQLDAGGRVQEGSH
ncbi:cathepsin B, putative [Perkinsus marinus ATCC 50983]|uniref:Cathepsin B, putative n=1 Tax=Perkinsus marinus (strain ATCC 50983 / TXsc) TaxID=423536 RepID=C5LCC0_PERM5|nr:cathepsin B, putative [Perkinsus marinus ATCC 50983]EER05603.1 cathepsin B, putative [Perkinsus marinus ATCC 50983]|eukprot:XP_002773787.1 cathepsin B, putative [Perkinsus marinus ATCC 50983]